MVGLSVAGMHLAWTRETPLGADERRWLEEACALALACSLEVHGPDAVSSQLLDIVVIGRAAELLWSASPGAPSWLRLDVDALVERLDCVLPPGSRDCAMATLITFIHWMHARRYFSPADSMTLLARCEAYVPEAFRAMGYRVEPLPAALRPC